MPTPSKNVRKRLKNHGLSPKHQAAVDAYFKNGFNQAEALKAAGYSENTAETAQHSVFGREDVRAEIERRQKKLAEKSEVTVDRVVKELAKIGFANFGDLFTVTEDGQLKWDFSTLTPDQRAVMSEVKIKNYKEGRGPAAEEVEVVGVKFADKKAALELLGRFLGMFKDKVELEAGPGLVERLMAGRQRVKK